MPYGSVKAASEQGRYSIRALHVEMPDGSDLHEMCTELGLKAG